MSAPSLARSPFALGFTAGAGALLALVVLFGIRELATVLTMLVAAFFFAIGLNRPVTALMRRGLSRGLAVAVIGGVMLLALCGGLLLIVPPLVKQTGDFLASLPSHLEELFALGPLTELDAKTDLQQHLAEFFTPQRLGAIATGLAGGVASLAGMLAFVATVTALSIFMLGTLDKLTNAAYRLVAASRRDRVRALGDAALSKIGSYLVGSVSIAALAGVTTFLYTAIAGIPYPLLLALVVAVFDLIPQIGATLGATIVTLVALSQSLTLALITIAFFVCYQGLENWVIYPKVMGRAVQISSLAAFVAALMGGALFGILGILIAVPVYASIQLVIREVVHPLQDAR